MLFLRNIITRQGFVARAFTAALVVVVLAIILAEFYTAFTPWLGAGWLAAALIHTVFSVMILGCYAVRGKLTALFSANTVSKPVLTQPLWSMLARYLQVAPWRMYLPAALVVGGTFFLMGLSRVLNPTAAHDAIVVTNVAWILWVPVVEEIVFRAGIGEVLRRYMGFFLGSWFSAICFAVIHSSPTLGNLSSGLIGLPVGPFVLGLCCELLFGLTGRILPVIMLHAACNATVVMFAWGDERWLQWLSFLYS